jgi:hypothetical protein
METVSKNEMLSALEVAVGDCTVDVDVVVVVVAAAAAVVAVD